MEHLYKYPGKHGNIPELKSFVDTAKAHGVKTVVAADLMSLCILEAPGHYGVDVWWYVPTLWNSPGYGGPHAAFFATLETYKRNIPGRIIGQTRDVDEAPALRMALQTREQH